jgi:WD40 repeat protein
VLIQVAFVRNTHYLFTVGKDKSLKYWDVDKFELLLTLDGHHAEVSQARSWTVRLPRLRLRGPGHKSGGSWDPPHRLYRWLPLSRLQRSTSEHRNVC